MKITPDDLAFWGTHAADPRWGIIAQQYREALAPKPDIVWEKGKKVRLVREVSPSTKAVRKRKRLSGKISSCKDSS